MEQEPGSEASAELYRGAERRVGWLTWIVGLAGAVVAFLAWSPKAGAGVAAGALLGWLNGRWIGQATDAIAKLSVAQAGGPKPVISRWVYIRFFARYGLIGLVIYVMFARFTVPVVSILLGLLALGLAAMIEGVYEASRRPK
jgi:hypothetical protein